MIVREIIKKEISEDVLITFDNHTLYNKTYNNSAVKNEETLEKILDALALDDYFELLSSERKGEKMYVISLRANGYAFKRCFAQQRRDAAAKMLWAVASAIVAFFVGFVLKRIF